MNKALFTAAPESLLLQMIPSGPSPILDCSILDTDCGEAILAARLSDASFQDDYMLTGNRDCNLPAKDSRGLPT